MNKLEKALIEHKVEDVVTDLFDEKTVRTMKGINKIASKQGGDSIIKNYQLLGKRTLIVVGGTLLVVNVVTSVASFIISRKSEEKRVERIVRRVLEEEREKEARQTA